MRSLVFLSLIAFASATDVGPDTPMELTGTCVLDGGEAASDLLDAALFIWGSTQRCTGGPDLKCQIDVASSVEAISAMVSVIMKAVDKCEGIPEHKCGLAANRLVKSLAGLTVGSGGLRQKCFGDLHVAGADRWAHGGWAQCVLNIKQLAKHLIKMIKALMTIEDKCDMYPGERCASNSLKVTAAAAALGEYVAATLGQCGVPGIDESDALCAEYSLKMVHHTEVLTQAGLEVHNACPAVPAARLYAEEPAVQTPASSPNLLLGAFLPVTAIVGFVGGRFFAKHRSRMEDTREYMSDHE